MHNPNAKKELSSLLIFVPIMALGIYVIFLAVSIPFQAGLRYGQSKAPFRQPLQVDSGPAEVFDHKRLIVPNEELITLGARIYSQQCASCHGAEGLGNGPAGQNLAIKPRAFNADLASWKIGASTLQMYETLENGVGGNMPAFAQLNPRQRYAVIHFIHAEFMAGKEIPQDPPEAIASLPEPSTGGGEINIDSYLNPRIPVTMAIDNIVRATERPIVERAAHVSDSTNVLGQRIYLDNCASCHGPQGQGMMPRAINRSSLAQLRQLSQGPALLKVDAPWVSEYSEFRIIVTEGIPGGVKPGHPTLTEAELQALYDYTLSLR